MKDKKIISFEAPDNLKEALRVEAFKQSITVSALIRQILEDKLTKEVQNDGRLEK